MSIASLVEEMVAAGATPQLIAIAVRAVEERDDAERARRAKRAEQKAKERAMSRDSRATVAMMSHDINATVAIDPSPEKELSPTPPIEKQTPSQSSLRSVSKSASAKAFDQFWKMWPNKVGKPVAQRAFAKVSDEIEAIISGVERYIRDRPPDREWLNPATFLNQRRWEDAPAKTTNGSRFAQPNPEKSVHAAAERIHQAAVAGELSFPPPPTVADVLASVRHVEREDDRRMLSSG